MHLLGSHYIDTLWTVEGPIFCAGHFKSDFKKLEKDNKQKDVDKTTERKLNIYRLGLRFGRIGLIRFVYFQFFQGVLSWRVFLGLAHTERPWSSWCST